MKVLTQDAERLTNIILIKCRSHSNVNTQKIWGKVGKRVGKGSVAHSLESLWLLPDNEGCGVKDSWRLCRVIFVGTVYSKQSLITFAHLDGANLQFLLDNGKYISHYCDDNVIAANTEFVNNKLSISLNLFNGYFHFNIASNFGNAFSFGIFN